MMYSTYHMSPSPTMELDKTNRTFEAAIKTGDFGAIANVYTKEARILPPGAEMISGTANIVSFWQQAAAGLHLESVELQTVDVSFLNDTAYEIGRAVLNMAGGATAQAKYVVIWKKEDATWKWHIDIWNAVS